MEVHHQYNGGHAAWTCHIINTEKGVQYMDTDTAQGVVGGCIYLENDIYTLILYVRFSVSFHSSKV